MLKVVEYLKANDLQALKDNYSIIVREYDDRVVLNYDQIDSPKFDPIVQECRGLILSLPNYEIINVSFSRFYNYNEDSNHDKFDISKAIAFEKVDGSLISVYNWKGQWIQLLVELHLLKVRLALMI